MGCPSGQPIIYLLQLYLFSLRNSHSLLHDEHPLSSLHLKNRHTLIIRAMTTTTAMAATAQSCHPIGYKIRSVR